MRKPYSPAFIAEVVALAVIQGAELTAKQKGVDPRSVRGWCAKAGKAPADALTTPEWRELGDLARANVASALASGKVRPKDAAVIAAIAQRNVRDVPVDVEPENTPEQLDYAHRLEAALAAKYGIDVAEDRAGQLIDDLILDLIRWSLNHDASLGWEHDEEPEALVARLPDDWDAYRVEHAEAQRALDAANDARRARSREVWPHYYAGRITEEEAEAWLRGDIGSPIAIKEAEETAQLLAAAEAFLRATA